MPQPVIYAIELGGAHFTAGAFVDGRIVNTVEEPTPGKRSGADELLEIVKRMVAAVAVHSPPMEAAAVSFSSLLNLRDKPGARAYGPLRNHEVLVSVPHYGQLHNVPFFEWLEAAGWGVPLHVENDVNTALRSATNHPTAVSVNMGTGVAAAIKRDNSIVHSPNTWSCYQIGHGFRWSMPEELTRKCACGTIGCLEAAIGAKSLADRYGVRPEDAAPDVYALMGNDIVTYLSPAITELIEKSGIEKVLLSGRAAHGFTEAFGLASKLEERITELRGGKTVTVQLIDEGTHSGLVGVSLAAIDYEIAH